MVNFGYVVKSFVEDRVNAYFKDIPKYIIEIGVFADTKEDIRHEYETITNKKGEKVKRKKTDKNDAGEKVLIHSDITNAEIMFIMEYGSPTNHIPARPVLEKTIKYAKENLLEKAVSEGLQDYLMTHKIESFKKALDKMCLRMENYAKTGIRRKSLGLEPNALYTIEMKGSDIPLLDTGQLANSIRCVCRKY